MEKSTYEIANRLVDLCRQGQWEKAQSELYDENVVSIEMDGAPTPKVQGLQAIKKKGHDWNEMIEESHGGSVSDPVVAGNFFTVNMTMDATYKQGGRQKMEEVCVYEVKDGKVVREQFFYDMPQQS